MHNLPCHLSFMKIILTARSHLVRSVVPYLRTVGASGVHLLSTLYGHHLAIGQYQELGGRCVVSFAVGGFVSPEVASSEGFLVFLLETKRDDRRQPARREVKREQLLVGMHAVTTTHIVVQIGGEVGVKLRTTSLDWPLHRSSLLRGTSK